VPFYIIGKDSDTEQKHVQKAEKNKSVHQAVNKPAESKKKESNKKKSSKKSGKSLQKKDSKKKSSGKKDDSKKKKNLQKKNNKSSLKKKESSKKKNSSKKKKGSATKKKSSSKKKSLAPKKHAKAKKVSSNVRQSGCLASNCLDLAVSYISLLRTKITNYQKQIYRINKTQASSSAKGGKQNSFSTTLNQLITAGGGNVSDLVCGSSRNNSGKIYL
jgi:hypothetical protein